MNYAELLIRAADVIDEHGWHRNMYHGQIVDAAASSQWVPDSGQSGPHCLVGSIIRAAAEGDSRSCDHHELQLRYDEHRTGQLLEINMYRINSAADASAFLRARAATLQ